MKSFLVNGILGGVVFTIAAIGMVGCAAQTTSPSVTTTSEGEKSQAPPGTTAARQDTALVRFINADPDAKGLDIWSDGSRTFSNIAYKAITPYIELPAHAGRFDLRAKDGAANLAVGLRELFPGRHYTLVALPTKKDRSRLAVITDNLGAVEPGQARVRLINATAGVGDLDLYLTDTKTAGTKSRIQHGIDASTVSSFSEVDPGTLEIRAENKPALAPLSNLKVEAGSLYTFIVTGVPGSLDVVRVEDRIEGAGASDRPKSQS